VVVMNFWSFRIGPNFKKSFWNVFFFVFTKISMPNGYYIIEISKWGFILMDFMDFSFKIFKMISPYYQLTTTFFNMGFHLVLKCSISEWNCNNQKLHEWNSKI
jgi:hypothetical protein